MGQGQSQSDKSVASRSSSTSSSKGKKSKRRSSSKSTSSQQSSRASSSIFTSPSSEAATNGKRPKQQSQGTPDEPGTSVQVSPSAITPSTHAQDVPSANDHHRQRGSFSAGGERSGPSRQFSLTRQTPSSSSSQAQSTHNKHAQIEKYFNKYKDTSEESILAEGMERFCVDLGVDPTEFIVLVLAWKFEASQMCRFTREEFMNGCQKMKAHNAKSLRERFPDLLAEAKDQKNFKNLYNFTFSFGLDHSSGQRSLPTEMAVALWNLVFTQAKPELLDHWFAFLKETEVKGISRDTWNMFLPFVETTLPDLSNYDESEAWPSLFDDFVEGKLSENTTL